jgi:hypothetical protein
MPSIPYCWYFANIESPVGGIIVPSAAAAAIAAASAALATPAAALAAPAAATPLL